MRPTERSLPQAHLLFPDMSTPSSQNGDLYSTLVAPGDVMHPALDVQNAVYVDINPLFDPQTSPAHLLLDVYAVLYGSIANLLVCPPGGRARIFQEDYFSGLITLLQEPFDAITASSLAINLTSAIKKFEPRLADVSISVDAVDSLATYVVNVRGSIVGIANSTFQASYSIPVKQG